MANDKKKSDEELTVRDRLSDFFTAADAAASRSRWVLYSIVFFTIITFTLAVRTSNFRWEDKRLESAEWVVKYFKYIEPVETPDCCCGKRAASDVAVHLPWLLKQFFKGSAVEERDVELQDKDRLARTCPKGMELLTWMKGLQHGKELTKRRHIIDLQMARAHLDERRRTFNDDVLRFQLPIIGIVADINMAGPILCFVLLMLMILLRMVLAKDLEILKALKSTARNLDPELQKHCYYRLSFAHVLMTVPSSHIESKDSFWVWVPTSVAIFPCLASIAFLAADTATYQQGVTHSENLMLFTALSESLFTGLLVVLTWSIAQNELREMSKEWRGWFKSLHEQEK